MQRDWGWGRVREREPRMEETQELLFSVLALKRTRKALEGGKAQLWDNSGT